MKYTLDTIPVLDAYKQDCECPLCALAISCEDGYVDTMMASAYMEPEWRIRTNKTGFCTHHFQLMFERRNRLGLALMTHTHMMEVSNALEAILSGTPSGKKLFSFGKQTSPDSAPARIRARLSGCVLCEQIDTAMRRYAFTVSQLYFTNAEFKKVFEQSKGFCLPHLALVLEAAEDTLSGKQMQEFQQACAKLELDNLRRVEGEVKWFTEKFDYRNQDKPWGTSRDACERAINKLMGACVGKEAERPAHND